MIYTFVVPIGDWSDDGHGKCDMLYVKTNTSRATLFPNYASNVALFGFGLDEIASNYEDSLLPRDAYEILMRHDFQKYAVDEEWGEYFPGGPQEDSDEIYLSTEKMLDIVMFFYGYGIEDFEWEPVKLNYPSLVGWGTPVTSVGYGLFY